MGLFDALFHRARRMARRVRDQIIPPPEPEEVIAGRLDGMRATIVRCTAQLGLLSREQRELEVQVHRNANQITFHLREARLCAARGEHELAAEHLRARARHERLAGTLEGQLHDFRRQIELLTDHVRGLELTVEDARRRRQLLIAQRDCIQAHLLMEGAPAGNAPGAGTMGDLMQDLETEVNAMEHVAQLTAGHTGLLPSPDDAALSEELMRRRVDDELGQLKRQVAAAEPRALPALADDDIVFITG